MSFLFILPVCLGYLSPLGNNHLSVLTALSLTVFVLLLNIEFFNIFWILAAHQMYYLQVFSPSFWLLSLHFFVSFEVKKIFCFKHFHLSIFAFHPHVLCCTYYICRTQFLHMRENMPYVSFLFWLIFLILMIFNPFCFDINWLSNHALFTTWVIHHTHRSCKVEGTHIKAGIERLILKTTMTPQRVDKEIRWTKFMPKYKPRLCVEINYYTQQKWFSW